jgi:hypothetical protein
MVHPGVSPSPQGGHPLYPSHAQYRTMLTAQLHRWLHRQSRRLPEPWHEAARVLLRLDLDPARPLLRTLSAPGPRGRPPYAPLCVLRAFLLMLLLHSKRLPQGAHDLRTHPRLAQIAGCTPFQTPAVGTFDAFIDRLADGPSAPPWAHGGRPSRQRQGRHRRPLKREQAPRHTGQASAADQADTVTERLAQALLATAAQPRPQARLTRLEDLRCTCGVIPSAQRGLLGALQAWGRCGDGACRPPGASPQGRPTCDCRAQGIFRCDHDRCSRDPTATWGYDASRDTYCFGHRSLQHGVVTPAHTLPVHLMLEPGQVTDFTRGPRSLERFLQTCATHALPVTMRAVVYDSGLDAHGLYHFVQAKAITPVIALNPRRGPPPAPPGTATHVNAQGVPRCPAGRPMRRHSLGPGGRRLYAHCPVQRPTRRARRVQWRADPEECPRQVLGQPTTQRRPVVSGRTGDDPRLSPPLPRDSATFQQLMAQRTGCERANSYKKVTSRLGERPCRSATQFLSRLSLVRLLEPACVWLAEDRKQGDNEADNVTLSQRTAAYLQPCTTGRREPRLHEGRERSVSTTRPSLDAHVCCGVCPPCTCHACPQRTVDARHKPPSHLGSLVRWVLSLFN